MAKKVDVIEEEMGELEEEAPLRVSHDFLREDLNDLRDAVNELHAERG